MVPGWDPFLPSLKLLQRAVAVAGITESIRSSQPEMWSSKQAATLHRLDWVLVASSRSIFTCDLASHRRFAGAPVCRYRPVTEVLPVKAPPNSYNDTKLLQSA